MTFFRSAPPPADLAPPKEADDARTTAPDRPGPPRPAPERSRAAGGRRRLIRRRGLMSPLSRRILAVNLLAPVMLVVGLLYLDEYHKRLIATELEALKTEAEMFAAAIGEGAVIADSSEGGQILQPDLARQMVRRLVEPSRTRARLFDLSGELVVDSRMLMGPGGSVQIEVLAPPPSGPHLYQLAVEIYDRVTHWLPSRTDLPPYKETSRQVANDYQEVLRALAGESTAVLRTHGKRSLMLTAAVPVQRYKQVQGAILLSKNSADIDQALFEVRLSILVMFLLAFTVTVLLSFYLSGTIARPVFRLAAAADSVRGGQGRHTMIPDMTDRNDEIGDLSGALHDMTGALWARMDAIERFAADVAHEIKNPLTSLRSAVETASLVKDPERQRKLMQIIMDDVQRLDRLISDISDASRLDAELSRAESEPVDLGRLLATLVDVYQSTTGDGGPRFALRSDALQNDAGQNDATDLMVRGIERRLVQVFRNLISNAISFSPANGLIAIAVRKDGGWAEIAVDDDGPGIPEGKLAAIFDRFYTERPADEKFGTHSGLGLSISQQIVEAHKGTIRAENRHRPDGTVGGARFVVRLPLL